MIFSGADDNMGYVSNSTIDELNKEIKDLKSQIEDLKNQSTKMPDQGEFLRFWQNEGHQSYAAVYSYFQVHFKFQKIVWPSSADRIKANIYNGDIALGFQLGHEWCREFVEGKR